MGFAGMNQTDHLNLRLPRSNPPRGRSPLTMYIAILTVLAVSFTAWAAREFLLPVGIAALLAIMLSPITRALERLKLPASISAAIVTGALIAAVFGAGYLVIPDIANVSD